MSFSPVLIWFIMALLLFAGLWSSNNLASLVRVFRNYSHMPAWRLFIPAGLSMAVVLGLLAIPLNQERPQTTSNVLEFHESFNPELHRQGRYYLEDLMEAGLVKIDRNVVYRNIRPEIAYSLGTVLSAFRSIAGYKYIILSSVNERRHPDAYHRRNLAIDIPIWRMGIPFQRVRRLQQTLQERLGADYEVLYGNGGFEKTMQIQYVGPSWKAARILSLPIFEAATLENVHPSLLLGWASVASHFDLQYDDQDGHIGLLGLSRNWLNSTAGTDSLELRQYLRLGAKLLAERMALFGNDPAKALASLKLGTKRVIQQSPPWWRDPATSNWVDQVLLESKDYRFELDGHDLPAEIDSLQSAKQDSAMGISAGAKE